MRQIGLVCLVIALFVLTWAVIVPREPHDDYRPGSARPIDTQRVYVREQPEHSTGAGRDAANTDATRKVTFQEVSEKSRDALATTAVYMKQEKEILQSRMSVTLQRVDRELARLRAEAEQAKAEHKGELNQRIVDLQQAKASLLNLKDGLRAPTQAAWTSLKTNWNRLEVDINARMQADETSGQKAG